MSFSVEIFPPNGPSVTRPQSGEWENSGFWWQEGNGSCDCNREMEWRRGMGWSEEDVWADDTGFCKGGPEYRIVVRDDAGEVLWSDR